MVHNLGVNGEICLGVKKERKFSGQKRNKIKRLTEGHSVGINR